jgi:hypothetical protein
MAALNGAKDNLQELPATSKDTDDAGASIPSPAGVPAELSI